MHLYMLSLPSIEEIAQPKGCYVCGTFFDPSPVHSVLFSYRLLFRLTSVGMVLLDLQLSSWE